MSKRKVNLEEILNNQIDKDFNFRLFYGEATTNNVISAMKEACRQVLELADENSTIDFEGDFNSYEEALDAKRKQSILNTINQVE